MRSSVCYVLLTCLEVGANEAPFLKVQRRRAQAVAHEIRGSALDRMRFVLRVLATPKKSIEAREDKKWRKKLKVQRINKALDELTRHNYSTAKWLAYKHYERVLCTTLRKNFNSKIHVTKILQGCISY